MSGGSGRSGGITRFFMFSAGGFGCSLLARNMKNRAVSFLENGGGFGGLVKRGCVGGGKNAFIFTKEKRFFPPPFHKGF